MKILISLFTVLLFIGCKNTDSNTYNLQGNALGFENGTNVVVYEINKTNQPVAVDTLIVNEGKFSATYPKQDDVQVQLLKVDGTKSNIIFFAENENITASIYKDSIAASHVVGGRQNELYNEFNKTMRDIAMEKNEIGLAYQQAQKEQDGVLANEIRQRSKELSTREVGFKRTFVAENNNSIFSLMVLSEMVGREEVTGPQANSILEKLSPKMMQNDMVVELQKTIDLMKKADIGGQAPSFTAPTPEGTMLSLDDALGKYTIIDFWASWCRPCRLENPNVVRVYQKYHDKGLNIISVSLDRAAQKERWVKAIEKDQMDWYHVSNLKFWQDPIARQYNVRSIPTTFLLDENGVIIDKNLRGAALEAKIASLLD